MGGCGWWVGGWVGGWVWLVGWCMCLVIEGVSEGTSKWSALPVQYTVLGTCPVSLFFLAQFLHMWLDLKCMFVVCVCVCKCEWCVHARAHHVCACT